MSSNPPAKKVEYTPEQRRLLARAYRLILSWYRDQGTPEGEADRNQTVPAGSSPQRVTDNAETESAGDD